MRRAISICTSRRWATRAFRTASETRLLTKRNELLKAALERDQVTLEGTQDNVFILQRDGLMLVVLEIARKAGHLPLGTFDKALSKLDGAERL